MTSSSTPAATTSPSPSRIASATPSPRWASRGVNPGSFSYSWYPSLDNSTLGIGATGDYWLSGLAARERSYGKTASIQASDQALPDQAVTDQRFGPSLVAQPLPGTESGVSWQLGARPRSRPRMTLTLTNVAALTLDARTARLETGTITIRSDGSSRFTIARLARGTEVLEHHRVVARANRAGVAVVRLHSGTTVLRLVRSAHASRRAVRRRRSGVRRRRTPAFTG